MLRGDLFWTLCRAGLPVPPGIVIIAVTAPAQQPIYTGSIQMTSLREAGVGI